MCKMKRLVTIIGYSMRRIHQDALFMRASALAYAQLLALVPCIIFSVMLVAEVPVLQSHMQLLQNFIINNFVATSASTILLYLNKFMANVGQISWLNLVLFMCIAFVMLNNITNAFDAIWGAYRRRPLWHTLIIYVLLLFAAPILLGVAFVFSSYLVSDPIFGGHSLLYYMPHMVLQVFAVVLNIIFFAALNYLIPTVKVPLRSAMLAGLVSAILFGLAKYAFGIYIMHVGTYKLLYGALAVMPVFLLWLYVSWLTILFGTLVANIAAIGIRQV